MEQQRKPREILFSGGTMAAVSGISLPTPFLREGENEMIFGKLEHKQICQ